MELYYIYIDCGGSYMTMYICQSSQTYLQAKIGKFYYMQNISDFNNERKKKRKESQKPRDKTEKVKEVKSS